MTAAPSAVAFPHEPPQPLVHVTQFLKMRFDLNFEHSHRRTMSIEMLVVEELK